MVRKRIEILIEILTACNSPKKPTVLRHICNIPYPYLQKSVEDLVRVGFLEEIVSEGTDKRTKKLIRRTVKGDELVHRYKCDVKSFSDQLKGIVK